jgi:hypothetical protein
MPDRDARPSGSPLLLEAASIVELRRSLRILRCQAKADAATLKGHDAVDAEGRPVDPLDENAVRFSLPMAWLRVSRSESLLYVVWMRLCNDAAVEMLDDPALSIFDLVDDPNTDSQVLLDLLDAIEARLDRLTPPQ